MGIHENRKSSGKGHSQGPDPDSAREVTALRQKRLIYTTCWQALALPVGNGSTSYSLTRAATQTSCGFCSSSTRTSTCQQLLALSHPFEPRVPHEISGSRIEDFCQEEHIIMSLPPDFRTRGQAGQAMSGKPKLV